jgi:hypothetical protein
MRLSFVGVFLFATCSFGEMYRCERILTASVISDADVKKDTSKIRNSAQLSVVRTSENSMRIQIIQADAQVHSGNNMLKLDEPLTSLEAKMKEGQSEIKSDDDFLQVNWDVRLKYDITRQVPVSVEMDRNTKMKDLGFDQSHIVQESLKFYPQESGTR